MACSQLNIEHATCANFCKGILTLQLQITVASISVCSVVSRKLSTVAYTLKLDPTLRIGVTSLSI